MRCCACKKDATGGVGRGGTELPWRTAALEAIRIEVLAASLGVTKGGFYGEFADRSALVERMLDTWEQTVVDDVISQIENTEDDAHTKLRHLFELARRHTRAGRGLAVELAVRDWARRNPSVNKRLNRVDNRRMAYLRKLFRQIGCGR